jgi:hypothetical protein
MPLKNKELFLKEFVKTIFTSIHPPKAVSLKPITPSEVHRFLPQTVPIEAQRAPLAPTATPHLKVPGFEKISPFLQDPSISTIECPGPQKQIIINRLGRTQPVNITLTEQEIASVLNDFSARTRIPLIPGVFKAVFGNLLITAIISKYAGTRFVIQKRTTQPTRSTTSPSP